MFGRCMYGVVLWSESRSKRAVIWCEDHGDLAFYTGAPEDDPQDAHLGVALDTGDLIKFDLVPGAAPRSVRNPRVIRQGHCTQLADRLIDVSRRAVEDNARMGRRVVRIG